MDKDKVLKLQRMISDCVSMRQSVFRPTARATGDCEVVHIRPILREFQRKQNQTQIRVTRRRPIPRPGIECNRHVN
jgi:hypothetical protein